MLFVIRVFLCVLADVLKVFCYAVACSRPQLYNQLCCGCSLLEAALHGDPNECCFYMNTLCGVLVPLLASPLAAPRVSLVFLRLGEVAFDDGKLGKCVVLLFQSGLPQAGRNGLQ